MEKLIEGSGPVVAAKNIRKELKANFPGIKFSVTTSQYSMGNSIRVQYTNGPGTKKVEEITNRYISGWFDGMTDCYNYEGSAFKDRFGSAKYINVDRNFSDDVLEQAIERAFTAREWANKEKPSLSDYKMGNLSRWSTEWNGGFYDMRQEVYKTLSAIESI